MNRDRSKTHGDVMHAATGPNPEMTLDGTVVKTVFSNQDNGFTVIRFRPKDRGQLTAVGYLFGVQDGERLRLTGHWVTDRRFGKQFQVNNFLTVQPTTLKGIEKYLGSGLVPGIGKEMAKRLVEHFGLETLDVIDHQPERLSEVEGIGAVRSEKIMQAWQKQHGVRQVMIFLQSHGVSSHYAAKIFKRYGEKAIAWVRENPFRLAQEVPGIGFHSADKIARDMGITRDSPNRLAAGLLYALQESAQQGNIYTEEAQLVHLAGELLEAAPELLRQPLETLIESHSVVAVPLNGERGRAIYPPPLELAERGVAEWMRALSATAAKPLSIHIGPAISSFEKQEQIHLAPQQREAIEMAVRHKVMILTGGPGTGKTTLVRGILSVLGQENLKIALAAPTGRAAKRLAETTGKAAKTLHRLLEYQPQERSFGRNPENPLDVDLVVIDEASMLDIVLAYNLLKAVPLKGRLILVGDIDQLPSVGPGRVLADLIESNFLQVIRLTEIFRQAQQSQIVMNAHRVREGRLPIRPAKGEQSDFFWFEREDPEAALRTVKRLVSERIPRGFDLDPLRSIQVLTPMRRGLLGTRHLNTELQALLNPHGEKTAARGDGFFRVGDRVMQIRNNYDLDVFNGDIGHVIAVDDEEAIEIDFEGQLIKYPKDQLDELILAYACSVHKSQGSEYPGVVLLLHSQHFVMLERNLLYTALTRGRRVVVVVGNRRALEIATRKQRATRRNSLLVQRLRVPGRR